MHVDLAAGPGYHLDLHNHRLDEIVNLLCCLFYIKFGSELRVLGIYPLGAGAGVTLLAGSAAHGDEGGSANGYGISTQG